MNKLLKNCFVVCNKKSLYTLLKERWNCFKNRKESCSLLYLSNRLLKEEICNACKINILKTGIKNDLSPKQYELEFVLKAVEWNWWDETKKVNAQQEIDELNAVLKDRQERAEVEQRIMRNRIKEELGISDQMIKTGKISIHFNK